jgi:hypothetical protein
MGFTFDDVAAAKGKAESLETMHTLIAKDPHNAKRIFPYIGGEEVNNDPEHKHHRYVIDFEDFPLIREATAKTWAAMTSSERGETIRDGVVPIDYPEPVAADWPELLDIVQRLVKPQRDQDDREARRKRWWRFGDRQPGLYARIAPLELVLVTNAQAAPHSSFAIIQNSGVFANSLNIFAFASYSAFAVLQSTVHELWARFFSSSMKDDLRYNPSDCFRTFPFPENFLTDPSLEATGEAYHAFRAHLMVGRNEGLTKTYNRFHARGENAPDIARLRELHTEMDHAVLRAYGWDDLAALAAPEFIEQEADEGKKAKTRLDWQTEFKDEVLARLLALNAERAAVERTIGAIGIPEDVDDEIDERSTPDVSRSCSD